MLATPARPRLWPVTASAVGARALAALRESDGRVDPVPAFVSAGLPYARAGKELVWIGRAPRTPHPRMIVLAEVPSPAPLQVDLRHARQWVPSPCRFPADPAVIARRLASLLPRVAEGRGFAPALAGRPLAFPLELALPRMRRLAAALAAPGPDPRALEGAALDLIGVGPGLTPSGDDVVGGMLLALRLRPEGCPSWHGALADAVLASARQRTHPISAALLADLAAGQSYGVLHDFLQALAAGEASLIEPALDALVAIGHTSGWDLFAGLALVLSQPVCPFEV